MDHIVSISTNDVKIEDKYAVMQLNPTDLVTFHIVEPGKSNSLDILFD